MKLLKFDAELLETTKLNDTVKQLTFSVPSDFEFTAGQFVTAILEGPDGKLRRSYSIASAPSSGKIELCIKYVKNGVGSSFFHDMKPGDMVHMRGPMGTFSVHDAQDTVFIGAGTGIAPLRSMILDLLGRGHTGEIKLLMGYRHEKNALYDADFKELAEKHKNFTYHTIFSKPETQDYKGEVGWVQKLIPFATDSTEDAQFFLCGLKVLVTDITELLQSKGVPKENIHFERYD